MKKANNEINPCIKKANHLQIWYTAHRSVVQIS